MQYPTPEYTPELVNLAGRWQVLFAARRFDELASVRIEASLAFNVTDNWRASHGYPTQLFYVQLKQKAKKLYSNALVAQRIKRLPSIIAKLARQSDMKFSQMQDIGGCRVVLKTIKQVRGLETVLAESKWNHQQMAPKDYIAHPKRSGYRGIHLKYRFAGRGEKRTYSNLKVEIQLRTELQHQWATAVETVDTFTRQSLKSNIGRAEWERFFALMGRAYAIAEDSPLVPDTPTSLPALAAELSGLDERFTLIDTMKAIASIAPSVEAGKGRGSNYLLVLDVASKTSLAIRFGVNDTLTANEEYFLLEREMASNPAIQVVLVSASSLSSLKRAYPNYFLDITAFLLDVEQLIRRSRLTKE